MQTTDRGDGTYSIQFVPSHEGTTSVHVMLDGVHVRGSPMALSVHRDVDELARGALTGKLSTAVTGLRRGLAQTRRMQGSLRSEAEGLLQYVPVLVQSAAADLSKLLAEQQLLLKDARDAVLREGGERRRLHNLVQELRGNIRVYVRVKPLTADEAGSGMMSVLRCSTEGTRIECNAGTTTKAFDFDRVFHEKSTQAEVFSEVAGLVTSALDGCAPRVAPRHCLHLPHLLCHGSLGFPMNVCAHTALSERACTSEALSCRPHNSTVSAATAHRLTTLGARAATTSASLRTARRAAARRTRWRARTPTPASTSARWPSSSASSTRSAARATSTPLRPPSSRSTTSRHAAVQLACISRMCRLWRRALPFDARCATRHQAL